MKSLATTFVIGLLAVSFGYAGQCQPCCPSCGCGQLKKVCRVVPDVKKITETKYVIESEDVCLPGKSRCEQRQVMDESCVDGCRYEMVKVPTCDRVVTKKKLKKITTTIDKPTWKCVVETVCCQCGIDCGATSCGK